MDIDKWEDRKNCWVSNIQQGTEEWKNLRLCSISSSNISECVGRSGTYGKIDSRSEQQKKMDLAKILCGIEKKEFSEDALAHMARGTKFEPEIRKFHFQTLRKSGM